MIVSPTVIYSTLLLLLLLLLLFYSFYHHHHYYFHYHIKFLLTFIFRSSFIPSGLYIYFFPSFGLLSSSSYLNHRFIFVHAIRGDKGACKAWRYIFSKSKRERRSKHSHKKRKTENKIIRLQTLKLIATFVNMINIFFLFFTMEGISLSRSVELTYIYIFIYLFCSYFSDTYLAFMPPLPLLSSFPFLSLFISLFFSFLLSLSFLTLINQRL